MSADGAVHVGGEVPLGNFEAVAFDDWGVAVGAHSVFGGVAGNVADVDVVEALVFDGEVGVFHFLHAGGGYGAHFVFGVEAQQMKRCVGSEVIFYPFSQGTYALGGVAGFGNDEVGEFDVDAVQLEFF